MKENEIKLINQLDAEIDELEEQIRNIREGNMLIRLANMQKEESLQQLSNGSNQSGYTAVGLLGLIAFIVSFGIIVLGVVLG